MKHLGIAEAKAVFSQYLEDCGYDKRTQQARLAYITVFFDWTKTLDENKDLRDIKSTDLEAYSESLNTKVSGRTEKPYSGRTKAMFLSALRLLYRCLYLKKLILVNPARSLSVKFEGASKVKTILTVDRMNQLLDSIGLDKLRDRALFELLYSSGLRAGELCGLDIGDIDLENRMVYIRRGKNRKDRIVPMNESACVFLKKYLETKPEGLCCFPGKHGRLDPVTVNRLFKQYAKEAGLYSEGLSVHSIRHSTATHLLANGADLRYVQELLGHDSLETTALYTNELYENLKRIYKTYHPRENSQYLEADSAYCAKVTALAIQLEKQAAKREQHREAARKYSQANKEKVIQRVKDFKNRKKYAKLKENEEHSSTESG